MGQPTICKACANGMLHPETIGDKVIGFACDVCQAEHTKRGELA